MACVYEHKIGHGEARGPHDILASVKLSLASFPDPTQLSVACSTEFFIHTQGEPGNEAKLS